MLSLQSVTLRRGTRTLLENVCLSIQAGERWGIVGRNGTGKSSLLSLIQGVRDSTGLQPDVGDIVLPPQLALAHVAQETPAVDRAAIDYVMDGDTELRDLQAKLAQAETDNDGERQANLHGQLETIDAYSAPARAARLLNGLGFHEQHMQNPVADFSGGWRMRLNLAQALMCRSDILLLDEPTNHLDLDAVIWLQNWLQAYPGTVLLISHDRDFLDTCVDHIALLAQQKLQAFTGNYSAYERQHAAQLEQQQAAYQKQQRSKAHMQGFVERFRAKATKARQAQSRLKALARLEEIAPAHVDSPFSFEFPPAKDVPHPLLKLQDADLGYGVDDIILKDVKIHLLPGDRIGLLGPNGAGKSTLIKTLAGELATRAGNYEAAKSLRIGYFAQHQLEQLHGENTPLQHLQLLDQQASEQELRNYLGGFGFVGDQALAPVAPFSGGEKARLVLALLAYQRPNLLLLDEPTNHLDLDMRHALNLALQGFEGALIIVSHDRHLLRTVCDSFLLVANGKTQEYNGDLADYAQWLTAYRREGKGPRGDAGDASPRNSTTNTDKKQRRQQDAERRKKLQPYREKVTRLEKRLAELQDKNAKLQLQLADSSLYTEDNKARLTELLTQQAMLKQALNEAEGEWLSSAEELEAAER